MASFIQISEDEPAVSCGSGTPADDRKAQCAADTDLWIFRDGKYDVSGPAFVRDLARRIARNGQWVDCLIQAGELEAALADAGDVSAGAAAQLTDLLAHRVCTGNPASGVDEQNLLARIVPPQRISISPPEGFTYYALHPLDFARIIEKIPADSNACAVIGVRSIGTTLSAMTAAALRAEGRRVSRTTVRPGGHPYSRSTQFTSSERRWIHQHLAWDAQFLIVDEGPGRSGSTFLSIAEAVVEAGVARERIRVLGSREFDPQTLCAEEAAARWKGLRFIATTPSVNTRFEGHTYLGGGFWRHYFYSSEDVWPASWTQMERLKFLSPDGETFFKFEGMGPRGHEARETAATLATAGFSPRVTDGGDGFLAYTRIHGRPLRASDLTAARLEHMARYCAFRLAEFGRPRSEDSQLRQMTAFNLQKEFGLDPDNSLDADKSSIDLSVLQSSQPVLADGAMQPHEWLQTNSGEILKTDAISHGDNHFFPGPSDIAWDIAGAAIEWNLNSDAVEFLERNFRQVSGMDVSRTLPTYLLAYSVFRLGFCKMAATTVQGTPEETRLRSAQNYYRSRAEQTMARRK